MFKGRHFDQSVILLCVRRAFNLLICSRRRRYRRYHVEPESLAREATIVIRRSEFSRPAVSN